jgi:sugar phosphate permease
MAFVRDAFTLLLGFTAIRGLGQGALGLVSLQVISLWFVRRRGLAIGIAGISMALASAVFPTLMQPVLASWGWRGAYALLAGMVALTILPLGAIFFRSRPEDFGLVPDGLPVGSDTADSFDSPSRTLAEARRTPLFWLLLSGGFLAGGLGTGLVFHHFSIMANNGLSRPAAAGVFVPMAITTAGMNLLTGILLDRVRPLALLPLSMGLLCLSLVGATLVHHPLAALGYGLILGGMQGMQGAIGSVAWAHYFGRDHLGAIRGFAFAVSIVGAAVGPLPFAWGLDLFGSYRPMLMGLALLPLGAALAAIVMDFRMRRSRSGLSV